MSQDAIVEELQAILTNNFTYLAGDGYGDSVESKVRPGTEYKTVFSEQVDKGDWHSIHRAVTRTPDGRLFEWHYELGLTDYQDNYGPAEYGTPSLTEVEEREEVIVVTNYYPKRAR